ncbi:MAG TPA: biotin--[acetyl-CoA-carboxylase] ligase [Phycisphaerae bacterium]|nr:biotin--[acetyl-CoA-carboxylase] ligase [Phycisphaerales bacterium]HRX84742.1 biotin--[acetyl-CoA-carboxylase] ligase [Phycisphaerae bacterium]
MPTGRIDIARLRCACAGLHRISREFVHFEEIRSTNAHVLDLPADADVDGLVAITEFQSGGRGRQGNRWLCPRGAGILCTVGLADPAGTIPPGLLALMVPLALCDGIRAATGVSCSIDWPNDLVADDRKLAGILIEAHARGSTVRYAVGFGINCLQHAGHFPPELRDRATSLDLVTDQPVDRTAVLGAILTRLDQRLRDPSGWNVDDIREQWRQRAVGLGRRVCVLHEGRRHLGNLVDIDPTAAIVVQLDEGGRRLFNAVNTTLEWVK